MQLVAVVIYVEHVVMGDVHTEVDVTGVVVGLVQIELLQVLV